MSHRCTHFLIVLVLAANVLAPTRAAQHGEGNAYLYKIETTEELEKLSAEGSLLPGVDRTTKFLLPSKDDDKLLPGLFQNVNLYQYHQDFLVAEFPERFPALSGQEYLALVERRATRSYFAGYLFRFPGVPDATYGFDIFTVALDDTELPLQEEAESVYKQLGEIFKLGPVAYAPRTPAAIRNARAW